MRADIVHACPTCGTSTGWRHRPHATFLLSRVRWGRSYSCENCGLQQEECGTDHLPPDLRSEILAIEGVWGLRSVNMRAVAKVVAQLLNRGVAEIWPLVAERTDIAIGLEAEAQWVADKLGEKAEIVAVPEPDGLFALGEGR